MARSTRCMSPALWLIGPLLLVATACGPSGDQGSDGRDTAAPGVASAPAAPDTHVTGEHAADEHAHATEAEPQALRPIMQRLGSEMNALTYALMTQDQATVSRSAGAIAEHAPISAEEVARIRRMLGAEMAAFEAVDESVHVAAVRLREAAAAGDPALVVERLGEVQRGCVSCHTQFRERLRTDRSGGE